jgi:hypothetical protein
VEVTVITMAATTTMDIIMAITTMEGDGAGLAWAWVWVWEYWATA